MNTADRAEGAHGLDPAVLARARAALPDLELTGRLATFFHLFGDANRVRILSALAAAELRVGDLESLLGLSQSNLSHQLALLRSERIVRPRREGKAVWYALDDEHVATLIAFGRAHCEEVA